MTERIPQSTAKTVVFKAYLSSDHVSEATSKTIAITISKNGGAFGNLNAGATNATEISSGWYKVALDTTDTGTLGPLAIRGAVATIDDVGILIEVVSATTGGYTNLDAAISSRMATYTQPTGFLSATFPTTVASTTNITAGTIATVTTVTNQLTAAQIATGVWQDATAGDFTVSASIGKSVMNGVALGTGLTVNDITTKTGFSLSQSFPTNFSSLSIDGSGRVDVIKIAGASQTARDIGASVLLSSGTGTGQISLSSGTVTAGTVSDKTGYSLSQSFPTNFSSLAITVGGAVTVGTNGDKTGYTVSTVSDKTGYALISGYDPAKTAAQAGDAMALTAAYDAAKTAATQASVDTIDSIVDDVLLDTAEIGTAGAGLTNINLPNQTMDIIGNITGNLSGSVGSVTGLTASDVATIKAQTDKLTFDGANHIVADARKISTSATAADNLEAGAEALVESTCAAGSTTTAIVTNLTESTDDHYNGRVISFTSGALAGQASSISDYNGTTKTLTVVALTEAPADTDVFVIS